MSVNSCCLFVPLRIGLLIWGYFAAISICMNISYELWEISHASGSFDAYQLISIILSRTGTIMYFIFHIVLVAGLHKESSILLSVYKGFIVVSMTLEGIVSAMSKLLAMTQILYEDNVYFSYTVFLKFLFHAAVVIAIDLLIKVYILECVSGMISTLNPEADEQSKLEEDEKPDVIVHNNIITDGRKHYDSD